MANQLFNLTMKRAQILGLIFIISFAFTALSLRKNTTAASRGKVVADSRSSIFNLRLDEASIFSIQQASDSIEIKGSVCVLNENDEPTGKLIKMKPRNFPKWFIANCENGNLVDYRIVAQGTRNEMAIVTRIYPRP